MLKLLPLEKSIPLPWMTAFPAKLRRPFFVSTYWENLLNAEPVSPLLLTGLASLLRLRPPDGGPVAGAAPGKEPSFGMFLLALRDGFEPIRGTAGADAKPGPAPGLMFGGSLSAPAKFFGAGSGGCGPSLYDED